MPGVEQTVLALLQDLRPEVDFRETDNFLEQGALDSTDVVSLVADLDRTYDISISGQDILPENFANVSAIAALLKRYGVQS